jgi:hypothetical protein
VRRAPSWRRELALRMLLPGVALSCGSLIAIALLVLLPAAPDGREAARPDASLLPALAETPPLDPGGRAGNLSAGAVRSSEP